MHFNVTGDARSENLVKHANRTGEVGSATKLQVGTARARSLMRALDFLLAKSVESHDGHRVYCLG
jgi:hypothetical protein